MVPISNCLALELRWFLCRWEIVDRGAFAAGRSGGGGAGVWFSSRKLPALIRGSCHWGPGTGLLTHKCELRGTGAPGTQFTHTVYTALGKRHSEFFPPT